MRIIGGEARGRRIKAGRGRRVRPTADRVKETIFNLIGDEAVRGRVLDLFAGSGNLGLEALSRGAVRAVFLDSSSSATSVVEQNLQALGFEDRAEVIRKDVFKSIPLLAKRHEKFELIFVDPPYGRGLARRTVDLLRRFPLLEEHGMLVLEHSRREVIEPRWLLTYRQKAFGETVVTILLREEE